MKKKTKWFVPILPFAMYEKEANASLLDHHHMFLTQPYASQELHPLERDDSCQ